MGSLLHSEPEEIRQKASSFYPLEGWDALLDELRSVFEQTLEERKGLEVLSRIENEVWREEIDVLSAIRLSRRIEAAVFVHFAIRLIDVWYWGVGRPRPGIPTMVLRRMSKTAEDLECILDKESRDRGPSTPLAQASRDRVYGLMQETRLKSNLDHETSLALERFRSESAARLEEIKQER